MLACVAQILLECRVKLARMLSRSLLEVASLDVDVVIACSQVLHRSIHLLVEAHASQPGLLACLLRCVERLTKRMAGHVLLDFLLLAVVGCRRGPEPRPRPRAAQLQRDGLEPRAAFAAVLLADVRYVPRPGGPRGLDDLLVGAARQRHALGAVRAKRLDEAPLIRLPD